MLFLGLILYLLERVRELSWIPNSVTIVKSVVLVKSRVAVKLLSTLDQARTMKKSSERCHDLVLLVISQVAINVGNRHHEGRSRLRRNWD